ncbi:Imm8 family immunity protein [Mesorhizobium sp. KR9-304]|uniref:Imm8 family immunity protein n=1 Tax=Mesorhizobium sp. KR9-304 TaxID=3156614 RepID=UPI0032B37F08
MRAQYKGHRILDANAGAFALDTWNPRDPADFSVTIDFYAGMEGDKKADAFTVTVCSPNWVFSIPKRQGRFWRKHDLYVEFQLR